MQIGIVINPNAGDCRRAVQAASLLAWPLHGHELVCTESTADHLPPELRHARVIRGGMRHGSFRDSIDAGARLWDVDCVLALGGDGTVADIISGQRRAGLMVPVVGIGCGTANAGPFILTRGLSELRSLRLDCLERRGVLGLDVRDGDGALVATAFHDVVFSDSVVSTVEGRTATVCARRFLLGERQLRTPSRIGTPAARVRVNGAQIALPFPVGQIVAAPVHQPTRYLGQAVHGKMCWLPFCDKNAVLSVFAEPVICLAGPQQLAAQNALQALQVIFGESDAVQVEGMQGFAIIDGNPRIDMERTGGLCRLHPNPEAALTLVRPRAGAPDAADDSFGDTQVDLETGAA